MRLLVVVIILTVSRAASAGWWYTWSCTGNCAPGRLAASGTRGPFLSSSDCESARSSDSVNQLIMESGNFGTISYCSESDSPPSPGSSSSTGHGPPPTQSWQIGLIGGPGY